MKADIKSKWVKALRSGEYKQARTWLRKEDDSFCCLGVLCNLHAQEHPEIAAKQPRRLAYMGHMQTLPDEVADWVGLPDGVCDVLAHRNDGIAGYVPHTFSQIADYIEKYL